MLTAMIYMGLAYWYPMGSPSPMQVDVKVLQASDYETVLRVQVYGFEVDTVDTLSSVFLRFTLPGGSQNLDPGRPEVFSIGRGLAIPPDNDSVEFEVINLLADTLQNVLLYPSQPPTEIGNDPADTFYLDSLFYLKDTVYPSLIVQVSKQGLWRDLYVCGILLFPMQYNPAQRKLILYKEMTIRLIHGGNYTSKEVSPIFGNLYRATLLNFDQLGFTPQGQITEPVYLIVTPEKFVPELQTFILWKHQLGFEIKLMIIDEYWTPEMIRDEIISYYNFLWPRLVYVLLVGDEDEVPSWQLNYDGYIYYSDDIYAMMSEDFIPDLLVGRISDADCGLNMSEILDKIIFYQAWPYTTNNWLNKVTVVAYKIDMGGYDFKPFARDVEKICRTGLGQTFAVETLMGDYYPQISEDDLINTLENGTGILCYYGHGVASQTISYWGAWDGEHNWTASDISHLDNDHLTPIVLNPTLTPRFSVSPCQSTT